MGLWKNDLFFFLIHWGEIIFLGAIFLLQFRYFTPVFLEIIVLFWKHHPHSTEINQEKRNKNKMLSYAVFFFFQTIIDKRIITFIRYPSWCQKRRYWDNLIVFLFVDFLSPYCIFYHVDVIYICLWMIMFLVDHNLAFAMICLWQKQLIERKHIWFQEMACEY